MNIKRKILLLSALLFGAVASAQMNGSYTVGESGTYTTIQDACSALELEGQDGPVIFNIESSGDPYVESVTLNAVSGNSSTNTITFQSELLDASTVLVQSTLGNTFSFYDVSHVNFNHIRLAFGILEEEGNEFGGDEDGAYVVYVENGSDYSFDHVEIQQPSTTDAVYIDTDSGLYNIIFADCDVVSLNKGISLNSDDGNIENVSITNSSFSNTTSYCFEIDTEFHILNSTISDNNLTSTNGYGFYIQSDYGDLRNFSFTENTVTSANDGLYMYAEITAEDITIENNNFYQNMENLSGYYPTAINVEGYYGGINNINVNDNYIESSNDYSNEGIYIYAGDGQVNNVTVNNNEITGRYGIYINCYGGVNWMFDNNEIYVLYDGIYADNYGPFENTSITNNELIISSGDGIYLYSDANIDDLVITDNTVDADSDGIYLEAYGGGFSNCLVENNDINSTYSGIYFETNANIYDIDIINNDVISIDDYGLYMESDDANLAGINIANNNFEANGYYGIYLDCNANLSNLTLTGNEVLSYYESVYLYPYYGGCNNIIIDDNTIESTNYEGVYLYTDGGISDVEFTNNSVVSYYESVSIEAYYSTLENVLIDNNYMYSSNDDGLIMETGYAPFESITITNNEIYADTMNCCYSAIYLESDDSYMDNVIVTNNDLYSYGSGMEIEADYGNALNSVFDNNNIWAGDYGIEFDGFGENSSISRNNIYPISETDGSTYTGIYVYGYDGPTTGARINDNYMENVYDTGIEAEYMEGIEIQRNIINADPSGSTVFNLYIRDCYGANTVINANQILSTESYVGIYFYGCFFDAMSPASVTNNFVTNMEYSIFPEYSGNINFANNSVSSSNNINMALLDNCSNISLMNNIFRETANLGTLYNLFDNENVMIDNNVYDFDDASINFAEGNDYGTQSTLADFQSASSMDAASFEMDLSAIIVNDDIDLHVDCATTSLNTGISLPYVTSDIDGTLRPSSNVTIGAHEVNGTTPDILSESLLMCSEAEIVMMNPVSGTYLWSTSETTASITVTEPGTYSVTVTDNCGNTHTDEIEVYVDAPDASFLAGSASLTGLFSNTSVGGTSYEWDFGDGSTSTEENPTHLYDEEGFYVVTLTVTDDCGNTDTHSHDLTVVFVGVEEHLTQEDINIYPNPTNGIVNIEFNMLTGENILVTVMDLDGRTVLTDQIVTVSGSHNLNLDLTGYADGMYIFVIQSETARITKKVIKK